MATYTFNVLRVDSGTSEEVLVPRLELIGAVVALEDGKVTITSAEDEPIIIRDLDSNGLILQPDPS